MNMQIDATLGKMLISLYAATLADTAAAVSGGDLIFALLWTVAGSWQSTPLLHVVFTYAEIRRSRLVVLLLAQEMETLKFVELTRNRSAVVVVVVLEVGETETAALPEEEESSAVSLIGYDNTDRSDLQGLLFSEMQSTKEHSQ